MKGKIHMISPNAKDAFHKIQHLYVINNPQENWNMRHLPQPNKVLSLTTSI